jgi:hypothetical protein
MAKKASLSHGETATASVNVDGDHATAMADLYRQNRREGVPRIERDREIGRRFALAKLVEIPESGLAIPAWLEANRVGFSQQYANGCQRFNEHFDGEGKRPGFRAALAWFEQSGEADGWRTKKNTGWEFGLEVMTLYGKHLDGKSPQPVPKEGTAKKSSTLKARLSAAETQVAGLHAALEKVVSRYRQTEQGADYQEPLLLAVVSPENAATGTPKVEAPSAPRNAGSRIDAGRGKRGRRPLYDWSLEMLDSLAVIWASAPDRDDAQIISEWAAINGRTLDSTELGWAQHRLGSRKKTRERLVTEGKLNADFSRATQQPDAQNNDRDANDDQELGGPEGTV